MHTCRIDGECDIDPLINEKLSIVAPAERGDLIGELKELFTAEIFFPELNRPNAAVQSLFDNGAEIAPRS